MKRLVDPRQKKKTGYVRIYCELNDWAPELAKDKI